MPAPSKGIFQALLGDGRGLLHIVGLALIFSGCFAIFVALTRFFLPHDLVAIGFYADELDRLDQTQPASQGRSPR